MTPHEVQRRSGEAINPLVTAAQVAAYLDISLPQCYQLCRDGILPHVRIGRRIRFAPEVVLAWVERGGAAYPGGWRKEA